jgi:hypothetical protein
MVFSSNLQVKMEILNYREQAASGKIVAIFDVDLGEKWGTKYPNMRLKRGKNGGFFFSRPSYIKSEDGFGNKTWGHYPEFTDERWKDFSNHVMQLLKPFLPAR